MKVYSVEAVQYALSQIRDGDIFEKFSLDFLSKALGYKFIPAGGIRDRGIDGFEHTFHKYGHTRIIYQISIQEDYRAKIRDSLEKLKENKIKFNQFVYVTNIIIPAKDVLIDELIESYKCAINIYDLDWLTNHVNDSEGTIRSFNIFVDSYLHEFNRPGRSYTVESLEADPRVYVYLRQQVEEKQKELRLDKILADTLILYALDETDPDKELYLGRDEIIDRIRHLVKFDPALLATLIDERLAVLSKKPRRINYHKKIDVYCLRYEERVSIQNRNLNDAALYEAFLSDTQSMIEEYGLDDEVPKGITLDLALKLVHTLFYRQGIEFADFVMRGAGEDKVDTSLPELINEIVDKSAIKDNKQLAKSGLLTVIRNIVYNGTQNQEEFLTRLSRTYIMLLLMQCDPKLCTYFRSLASKLRIYVGTSIIIPALSEVFLEERNRRYTNLIKGAKNAGVELLINEAILQELVAHFRMIKRIFQEEYEGREDVFTDDLAVIYVREIMIRAFFYSRIRGQVNSFNEFINRFTSPHLKNILDDMVELLRTDFGIEYASNESSGIHLDKNEIVRIEERLQQYKRHKTLFGSKMKAHADAQVMLTIHALRERDNELGTTGIFGYRTWWLTSDVTTQKAAVIAAGRKYTRTCYMRPDFLYNYISLQPTKGDIDESFSHLFPTLLGVNLSWEMPPEVYKEIHKFLKEHKELPDSRIKAKMREIIDGLKQSPDSLTSEFAKTQLEELEE